MRFQNSSASKSTGAAILFVLGWVYRLTKVWKIELSDWSNGLYIQPSNRRAVKNWALFIKSSENRTTFRAIVFWVHTLCFGRNKKTEVSLRTPSHKLETSVIEGLDSGVRVLLEFCFAMLKAFFSQAVWYTWPVMAAVRFWVPTIFCLFLSSSCSLLHKSSFFGLGKSGSGYASCSGWVENEDLRDCAIIIRRGGPKTRGGGP